MVFAPGTNKTLRLDAEYQMTGQMTGMARQNARRSIYPGCLGNSRRDREMRHKFKTVVSLRR